MAHSDQAERLAAVTTFDRNVVVTAGAGTGKTTLLIDRLVLTLLRPDAIPVTEIVALTFTRKAAQEMKSRLRQRLSAHADRTASPPGGVAAEDAAVRATAALRQIEYAAISTLHAFAADLLRRFPSEAGIDPLFREDDGKQFEKQFQERWTAWLSDEMSPACPRRDRWKKLLIQISLTALRDLAAALSAERVPLNAIDRLSGRIPVPVAQAGPIGAWLSKMAQEADAILSRHPENRKIEKQVRAAAEVFRQTIGILPGAAPCQETPPETAALLRGGVSAVKGWEEDEVERAKELVGVATRLTEVNPAQIGAACSLLAPFVRAFRRVYPESGFISFDGLLVRTRDLLRNRPAIRRELKRRYRSILVDELQDTDPIQYDVLFYLAEAEGREAADVQEVRLAPGKLFVVGDPKQSIYSFRGADISAYQEVVRRMMAQGARHCHLTTNFRSHAKLLAVVNDVCTPLIQLRPGLQTEYDPLASSDDFELPFRGVTAHCTMAHEVKAGEAREREAAALAHWLKEAVIGRAAIRDAGGQQRTVRAGDVAILIRSLTSIHLYNDALRRCGIPSVAEGDKHFFSAQEVIDTLNLLRVVADPNDTVAWVGLLRSGIGGLTDEQIYRLHERSALPFRVGDETTQPLRDLLFDLHVRSRTHPVSETLAAIFETVPILLLAAGGGEQPVANIEKVRRLVLEAEGSFGARVAHLVERMLNEEKEEEADFTDAEEGAEEADALGDATVDAVRLMSIHKAKGLEFPVVILAGCHAELGRSRGASTPQVFHDPVCGLIGLSVGGAWDLAAVYLSHRARARQAEEEKRVLYVALTRAREHLALSFCEQKEGKRQGFMTMLDETLLHDLSFSTASPPTGPVEMDHPAGNQIPTKVEMDIDWEGYLARWNRRREPSARPPRFVRPSAADEAIYDAVYQQADASVEGEAHQALPDEGTTPAPLIGNFAHQFLEQWEFVEAPVDWRAKLSTFLKRNAKEHDALLAELGSIFETFFRSEIYRTLCHAHILGREIPFLMGQNGQGIFPGQRVNVADGGATPAPIIVDGMIDLVYESEGQLYVADYKTDRVLRPERYLHQARLYVEAVRRGLGRTPTAFQWIGLRRGEVRVLPILPPMPPSGV